MTTRNNPDAEKTRRADLSDDDRKNVFADICAILNQFVLHDNTEADADADVGCVAGVDGRLRQMAVEFRLNLRLLKRGERALPESSNWHAERTIEFRRCLTRTKPVTDWQTLHTRHPRHWRRTSSSTRCCRGGAGGFRSA